MIVQDNEMNPRMSLVFDSFNLGYQKINVGIGIYFIKPTSFFKNHSLALELTFQFIKNIK